MDKYFKLSSLLCSHCLPLLLDMKYCGASLTHSLFHCSVVVPEQAQYFLLLSPNKYLNLHSICKIYSYDCKELRNGALLICVSIFGSAFKSWKYQLKVKKVAF